MARHRAVRGGGRVVSSILDSAGMKWSRTEIRPSPTLARARVEVLRELDVLGREFPALAEYARTSPQACRAVLGQWKGTETRSRPTRSRPARRRAVLPAAGGILPAPTAAGGRLNVPPVAGGWRL